MGLDSIATQLKSRLDQLSSYTSTEDNHPSLSLEVLLDSFLALYTDCKSANTQNEHILSFLGKCNSRLTVDDNLITKLLTLRINPRDFEIIKTLATGAVGKVCLVRSKKVPGAYAMKVLKKSDLLTRREAAFFMEERNALVFSQKSPWITTLFAAFQDDENLYLVMEYVSGGSLRSLLNNKEAGVPEDEAKFYISELVVALAELHKHSFIHRDVKPENCLIDSTGHLKLADFGSCIRLSETSLVTSHETVGTPDYISPEILRAHEGGAAYGLSCDWWSLGVILFELLYDEVPFYSESLLETYSKIMEHEKHFAFPEDPEISKECRDLIQKLICKQEVRLGQHGAAEIKQHPWLSGINWDNIRDVKPPFIPELSGPEDTRYFEDEEAESKKFVKKAIAKSKEFSGQSLPFIGYTYLQNATAMIIFPNGESTAAVEETGQDKQKMTSIMAAKKSIEEEASTLRSNLARETAARTEANNTLTVLQKEKIKLETELKQTRLNLDHESHERLELEEKVSQMKKSLRGETQSKAENQELTEIRRRLEKDLEQVGEELLTEKKNAMKRELIVAELGKAKSGAEAEMKRLQANVDEEKKNKAESLQKLEASKKQADTDASRLLAIESKLKLLESERRRMEAEKEATKESLELEISKHQHTVGKNSDLVKSKAMLEIEIESLKKKLAESSARARDTKVSESNANPEELESLKSQNVVLLAEKSANADEIESLLKAKTVLEMEITDAKKAYLHEGRIHSDTKAKLEVARTNLTQEAEKYVALMEAKTQVEEELATCQTTIGKLNISMSESEDRIHSLQSLSEALTAMNASLTSDLHDVQVKAELEAQSAATYKIKVQELQETVSLEMKARIGIESQYQAAEQNIDRLNQEIERLRSRVESIIKEHESSIGEHDMIVTSLKSEAKFLEERLATEQEIRFQVEDAKAVTNRWVAELEEDLKREIEIRSQTEKLLEQTRKNRDQLETDLDNEKLRSQHFFAKAEDLEANQDILQAKIEAFEEKDKSTPRDVEKDKNHRAGFRLKMFFKNSKDNLDDTPKTPTALKIIELDEDGKDDASGRSNSHSMDSLASFATGKMNFISPTSPIKEVNLTDFFNPIDGLSGWIKVPKGGKVKKGWKLQFGLVRDNKLYMFERDRDVENPILGVITLDLTMDIFLAKTVSQNELIHASGKDIDSIFKVQTSSNTSGTDSASDAAELKIRIGKLQTDIELEIKMQQAHEKILAVTTDAHKVSVISQIDASNKRMRVLKSEVEKLQNAPAAGSRDIDNLTDMDPTEILSLKKEMEAELEDEIKKKEALNKLHVPDSKKKSKDTKEKDANAKDLEIELMVTDRVIAKLKDSLEVFQSNDQEKIRMLLSKMKKKKNEDILGHLFVPREFYKATDCAVCHEPLWDSKNHGYECSSCKMICHKACRSNIDVACQDVIKLKTVTPQYFMAKDSADRARWIAGLAFYRRDYERIRSSAPSNGKDNKRLSTFIDSLGSSRRQVSRAPSMKRQDSYSRT